MNRRGFIGRLFGACFGASVPVAAAIPVPTKPEFHGDVLVDSEGVRRYLSGCEPLMSMRDYLINVCNYKPDIADKILERS